MASRTKDEITKEAQVIAKQFNITVDSTHAGKTGALGTNPSMTWEQAMIRLQLLQIELLQNIRQNETNP